MLMLSLPRSTRLLSPLVPLFYPFFTPSVEEIISGNRIIQVRSSSSPWFCYQSRWRKMSLVSGTSGNRRAHVRKERVMSGGAPTISGSSEIFCFSSPLRIYLLEKFPWNRIKQLKNRSQDTKSQRQKSKCQQVTTLLKMRAKLLGLKVDHRDLHLLQLMALKGNPRDSSCPFWVGLRVEGNRILRTHRTLHFVGGHLQLEQKRTSQFVRRALARETLKMKLILPRTFEIFVMSHHGDNRHSVSKTSSFVSSASSSVR